MSSEGWLDRGGVRLHYVEWGAASGPAPSLFLLHGLSSNALFWSRLADRLPGRRLIALDQRSHGRSDRPQAEAGAYAMEMLTGDAAFAMERLGLERPVVLGHSWGATVALDLAATRAELVSGLGFIDGPAAPMSERLSWEDASRMLQPPLPRFRTRADASGHVQPWINEAWADDLQAYAEAGVVEDGGQWVLTLTEPVRREILRELYDFQPQLRWAALDLPSLMAVAGGDKAMLPWKRRGVELVQALMPSVRVRWYDSAHDIPLIRPDELAADVGRLCLRAAWHGLAAELSAVAGRWEPNQQAGGGWSAAELLAHLASTASSLPGLLAVAEGAEPASPDGAAAVPFDQDRWNASQLRRRQGMSPQELVDEVQTAALRLDEALWDADLSLPARMGTYAGRPLAEVMEAMLDHQRRHLAELRALLI